MEAAGKVIQTIPTEANYRMAYNTHNVQQPSTNELRNLNHHIVP